MAAQRIVYRYEHLESEDSDGGIPSTSHQNHSAPIIEDLLYEIDVGNYYRKLLNVNISGKPNVAKRSRAVQTEADVSRIPPSWLKAQNDLVNELYTSIGNLINSLFHSPDGSEGEVSEFQRLQFFEYVDGFWQSKYLPHVKIRASEVDRRMHSGSLKHDLKRLFKYAEQLMFIQANSDVQECETSGQELMTVPDKSWNGQAFFSEKLKPTKTSSSYANMPQPVASTSCTFSRCSTESGSCSSNRLRHASCAHTKISESGIGRVVCQSNPATKGKTRRCNSGDAPNVCKHVALSVPKTSAFKSSICKPMDNSQTCQKVRGVLKSQDPSNRPRRPLTPIVESGDGATGTSRVNLGARPKVLSNAAGQQRREQENCQRSVYPPAHKNFIKRNILALKEPVIRPRLSSRKFGYTPINI